MKVFVPRRSLEATVAERTWVDPLWWNFTTPTFPITMAFSMVLYFLAVGFPYGGLN